MEGKLITSFFSKSITAAKTVNHKVELIKHPSAHILLYLYLYIYIYIPEKQKFATELQAALCLTSDPSL